MTRTVLSPRAAWILSIVAAAAVLVPLFVWSPIALDDVRLDGGVLAIVAVLALGVYGALAREFPSPPPGTWLILAGLSLGLLPLIFLPWAQSVGGLMDRLPLLSALAIAALTASGRVDPGRLIGILVVGCSAASGLALAGAFGFDPFGFKPWPEAPPVAPFTGLNHAAELLTPLVVAAAVLLPAPRRAPLLWAATLLCALHAGVLGTLAGRLALVAGLGMAAWRLPLTRIGCGFVAAAFLVGELLRATVIAAPPSTTPIANAMPPSLAIRAELTMAALPLIPNRPLGIGLGRFEADYPEWRSVEEARLTNNDWKSRNFRTPKSLHNDPLQLLLECGWLGGALLLASLLVLLRGAPAWFLAPLGAFAVHGIVRSPLLDNMQSLALFALLAGAAGRAQAQLLRVAEPRRYHAAGFVLAVGALLALTPVSAQIAGELSVAQALQPDEQNPAAWLSRATDARPWDAGAWELRGLGYLGAAIADTVSGGDPAQEWEYARRCFEQALERQPAAIGALAGLVQVEMSAPLGDRARGLSLLARAEQLAGQHPSVRAARRSWLEMVRASHEAEGQARLTAGRVGAAEWLLSASLTEARVALMDARPALAQLALQRAARMAAGHRAMIERTAAREDLTDALLQSLTVRIFPGWPENLSRAQLDG